MALPGIRHIPLSVRTGLLPGGVDIVHRLFTGHIRHRFLYLLHIHSRSPVFFLPFHHRTFSLSSRSTKYTSTGAARAETASEVQTSGSTSETASRVPRIVIACTWEYLDRI